MDEEKRRGREEVTAYGGIAWVGLGWVGDLTRLDSPVHSFGSPVIDTYTHMHVDPT